MNDRLSRSSAFFKLFHEGETLFIKRFIYVLAFICLMVFSLLNTQSIMTGEKEKNRLVNYIDSKM